MNGELILGLVGLGSGIGVSWITNRRSNKTEAQKTRIDQGKLELDNRREDGEAYERAQVINQQIVEGLRTELTALQATIQSLRADLLNANDSLRVTNDQLRAEQQHSAQLENHIRDLEANARAMQQLLNRAGVTYPHVES